MLCSFKLAKFIISINTVFFYALAFSCIQSILKVTSVYKIFDACFLCLQCSLVVKIVNGSKHTFHINQRKWHEENFQINKAFLHTQLYCSSLMHNTGAVLLILVWIQFLTIKRSRIIFQGLTTVSISLSETVKAIHLFFFFYTHNYKKK